LLRAPAVLLPPLVTCLPEGASIPRGGLADRRLLGGASVPGRLLLPSARVDGPAGEDRQDLRWFGDGFLRGHVDDAHKGQRGHSDSHERDDQTDHPPPALSTRLNRNRSGAHGSPFPDVFLPDEPTVVRASPFVGTRRHTLGVTRNTLGNMELRPSTSPISATIHSAQAAGAGRDH